MSEESLVATGDSCLSSHCRSDGSFCLSVEKQSGQRIKKIMKLQFLGFMVQVPCVL